MFKISIGFNSFGNFTWRNLTFLSSFRRIYMLEFFVMWKT